jgi:hypothetical protein
MRDAALHAEQHTQNDIKTHIKTAHQKPSACCIQHILLNNQNVFFCSDRFAAHSNSTSKTHVCVIDL